MFRSLLHFALPGLARARTHALPLSGALLLVCAACDGHSSEQDLDPAGTGADASSAGDAAAAGHDSGAAPLDAASSPDARGPGAEDAARDSAPGNTTRDGSEPAPADASTGDAGAARADAGASDAGAGGGDASAGDPMGVASALNALFIDVPCAPNTPTPLANGATCLHPGTTQHIEKMLTMGGSSGSVYTIKLRVRGIWEPTKIQGGERPDKAHPFTVGGMLPAGTGSSDAISYQQYSIQVSEPKQTYWLNDHQMLAHDIHKEDYVATLRVAGGARVTVIMNDGNDHQIANWTKSYFADLPPYDKAPSTGQSLRLDVVSVELAP